MFTAVPAGPTDGVIDPPGSKSITVVFAAVANRMSSTYAVAPPEIGPPSRARNVPRATESLRIPASGNVASTCAHVHVLACPHMLLAGSWLPYHVPSVNVFRLRHASAGGGVPGMNTSRPWYAVFASV